MAQALAYSPHYLEDLDREARDAEAAQRRAISLLIEKLQQARRARHGAEFAALLNAAQRVLQLSDLELARDLKVSRPTISRWTNGQSAPHALGLKPVIETLLTKARTKLRALPERA